ncbi:diguanylate cyclase domain-containing protein [Anaerobacillus sp. MEB173]|uniref:PAS domain-containing protein n=1 Tax=Anaerobacillus sp. MEB173 TaxID=3383345 RepID=UPI003F8ED1B5
MEKRGRLLAIVITIIEIAYVLFTYFTFGHEQLLSLFIILLILPFVWLLAKRYDDLYQSHQQVLGEKKEIDEQIRVTNQKNRDYELLFYSLEGAFYTFDVSNNKVFFSKGLEQIYGYPVETFKSNPNLWREVIHPDDYGKIEKDEQQLQLGLSTRIEYRIFHPKLGEKWVMKLTTPIQSSEGKIEKISGQMVDITKQKQLENELKQMAYYDELTDLPNRKALDRHIQKALARSKRHNHNFTIMFIDLDDFKVVNDTMGHDAGDLLLIEVVNRLNESLREEDLIARIGGDEFIVVLEETNKVEIEDIAKRIIEKISLPYMLNEKEANISLSIGISMYPDDGEDKETLIEHADKAMYYAKFNGKNNFKIYTSDLNEMEFNKKGIFEKWINTIQKSKLFNR